MTLWFAISSLLVFLFLIDDLFIDFLSLLAGLGPKRIDKNTGETQQPLAIMVANWKEYGVLEAMVNANSSLLKDPYVHLFLGVYPNDTKTLEVAKKLSKTHEQVHLVVNRMDGPTYKGQMLDEIIEGILVCEKELNFQFTGFILHDSEDVIDKDSVAVYRQGLLNNDFLQTPVLSLNLKYRNLVGATYMDEFAESHSKDMLVRQYLNAGIPSAGVGTCLKRNLILFFKKLQGGKLFPHKDLTEDYILGLRAKQYGFKSAFLCFFLKERVRNQLIATREFFPSEIKSSIRQKSRWTLGIAFQGWQRLGWFGSVSQRYFLWRDRKALVAPFVTINCALLFFINSYSDLSTSATFVKELVSLNLLIITLRLLMRMRWVYFHHNLVQSLLVPLRWPLAIYINTCAGLIAMKEFVQISLLGREVVWKKTEHSFPELTEINEIKNEIKRTNAI